MKLDVARAIDEGSWSNFQKFLVAGAALTIILDGVDNQLLGNAIPSLMKEWSLPRAAFSTALATSPMGMMLGGALGGWLGDRIGRRTALLGSVISFAAFTLAIAAAGSVTTLSILRFLAGLGLGGAMPNAATLASEYVPRRQRPFAVTLIIVCIPLGGMLAAFLSARVIPAWGWRAMFVAGGIVPIVLGLLLCRILPESPRFLARHPARWPQLVALLRKFGHSVSDDATFAETVSRAEKPRTALHHLFAPDFRRDTFALAASFFFGLMVNYLAFLLLVPALTGAGFTQPSASNTLGWWNIAGVGGALASALFIHWFGSRKAMLGLSLIAIASAFVLASMHITPGDNRQFLLVCLVLGLTINAVQTAMYALAAHVYPTEIRATGIGVAVAMGRVGNILASYVGNYALTRGGLSAFFLTFGLGMIVVFLALAFVRRHIDNRIPQPTAVEVLAPPATNS